MDFYNCKFDEKKCKQGINALKNYHKKYDEAKNEQAFVEGRILTLANMIKSAVVIPDRGLASDKVQVGSRVTVVAKGGKEERYTIVGHAEADPSQGRISNESPVGKALLGKRRGQEVEAHIPAGTVKLRIVKVE